jgi:hypothetical protein
MLPTIAALLFIQPPRPDAVNAPVTQSIWVYSHAGDPAGDEYLRIWGVDGAATPTNPTDSENFSYGYLKVDVSGLPAGRPKKATLILHNIAPPGFAAADLKDTPLQARPLSTSFDGPKWTYDSVAKIFPGAAKDLFGIAKASGPLNDTSPIELDVDLLQGPGDFNDALAKAEASTDHALCLALTSPIAPQQDSAGSARTGIYKLYSATAKDKTLRPMVKLEF